MHPSRVVKASESLNVAGSMLNDLIGAVAKARSPPNRSDVLWDVYTSLEYAVVMLKLHLKVENPGRVISLATSVEDIDSSLVGASDALEGALKAIEKRDYAAALELARSSRNITREILAYLRKTA